MDLSALKVAELREMATQRGLSTPSKCKKQELIDAITTSMAAEGADDVTVRTTPVAEGDHHGHPRTHRCGRRPPADEVCSNLGRTCGQRPRSRPGVPRTRTGLDRDSTYTNVTPGFRSGQ